MADAPVGFDILETLDVCAHFSLEISFEHHAFDDRADLVLLIDSGLFGFKTEGHISLREDLVRPRTADPVEGGQGDLEPFFIWNGDTEYSHLALSLLMAGVSFADNIHIALSADYLAFCAHLSDRSLYFHNRGVF